MSRKLTVSIVIDSYTKDAYILVRAGKNRVQRIKITKNRFRIVPEGLFFTNMIGILVHNTEVSVIKKP